METANPSRFVSNVLLFTYLNIHQINLQIDCVRRVHVFKLANSNEIAQKASQHCISIETEVDLEQSHSKGI